MSPDLLNSRDCLQFESPFRSLMTACEVKGAAERMSADAFEIRQEYMLPWLERNGIETAQSVDAHLASLISGLRQRRAGTVWSGEFDFNHRWAVSEAVSYFDTWRKELAEARELFDAKTTVLLSIVLRMDENERFDRARLGEARTVPLSEREFAVLSPHDSIRARDRWVYVQDKSRAIEGPIATLFWPRFLCGDCDTELEIERDEDDTNDQWRVRCCEQEAFGNSIAEVTINWNQWEGRFLRPFRHA